MEYKVFVFCDKAFLNIDFDVNSLARILASFNVSISEFSVQTHSQENFEKALSQKENLILFFKNQDIDKVIVDNINKLSNQKSIIDDQLVCFEKEGKKIIFAPFDSNWQNMLGKVNLNTTRANKTCHFKLFGLAKEKVKELMQTLVGQIENMQFSVIGEGLLTELFVSYQGANDLIDDGQVKIASLFKNNIFSENTLNLPQTLCQLARLKDIKIKICEGVTGGALQKELCLKNKNIKDVLESGRVQFLHKEITPENVYQQTLQLLDGQNDSSFLVNIQGEISNNMLTCIYTLGTTKSLDVYKNTFKTGLVDLEKVIDLAINAIMFNIIKKLRQNNLDF